MAVPFIDLTRLTNEVSALVEVDWKECLAQCDFVDGPRVTALEGALSRTLHVPYAVACANGTDALILALQAAGVTRGRKVALPNLTFWATYEAVVALGAIPILVDIDADDLAMSFDDFKRAFEAHRFEAAILVHLYGWASARLADFRAFCKERAIPLVEDAAQAFGVRVNGEHVLAGAEFGTLSFYPAKVVGGAMDGGAVTVITEASATLVRALGNHGRERHFQHRYAGWNSRMSALQAAYLNRLLPLSEKVIANRRERAVWYRNHLKDVPGIRSYGPPRGVTENGYLFVLSVEGKSGREVAESLATQGIGTGNVYPETIDEQPGASDAVRFGSLAVSKRFCRSVVNLPLFYGIRDEECEEVVAALLSVRGEDNVRSSG